MAREKTMNTNGSEEKVSKAFSWYHATSANGGAMLIAAVIASYFSVFMTDTMMIPAAAGSAIMFVTTLWSAISDPIMGVIADRTHSKWGRYRPYFIAAPILLTLFSTLLWINPDFSITGKIIWVIITYIGYGMTVTMYTIPHTAILPACIKGDQKRNVILTMGAGVTATAFTIGNSFTPQIKGFFESVLEVSNGYIPFMIACGILACLSFWGLFTTSNERYLTKASERPIHQDLKSVLKHKELTPFIIVWIMASMGYGLMFSSSVYYVMYYLARPDLISVYMLIISIGAWLSMVVFMPIVLKILKTGHKALIFTQVGALTCYMILFFFGKKSLMLLYIITFIATCIASMSNALVNVLVNDAIDYIQFKEGFSANGIIASVKGFAQKCGNTVTNSGILAVLAVSGYVAGAVGQQPESTMLALNFLRFGAPSLTAVIMLICLRFNPVEKHYAEIQEMKKNMKTNDEK